MALANIEVLALCALFGGVCAFYVSAVGFVLSALVTVLILAGLNWFAGGVASGWTLAGAFVTLQVGYFLGIVGTAVASSLTSAIAKGNAEPGADLHVDHE
jgi:hypothetical protein